LPTIDLFVRLVNLPERRGTSASSSTSSSSNCSGGPFLLNDQRIKANSNAVVGNKKKNEENLETGRLPFEALSTFSSFSPSSTQHCTLIIDM
jgi:hypothetical protein